MKAFATFAVAAAALIPSVFAHYEFSSIIVNGVKTEPYEYVRKQNNGNSPVSDINSTDLRCNIGGLQSGSTTKTYSLAPGSDVSFYIDWDTMYHPGPLNVYMAKAPSTAATYDGSGTEWFKIFESHAIFGGSSLTFELTGAKELKFKIPASTPPGEYLLRIEHVALHVASTAGGAQFFVECAQIKVTGSGTGKPGPKVALPGAYKANDPSLLINIYWPVPTSYTNPGPTVWKG